MSASVVRTVSSELPAGRAARQTGAVRCGRCRHEHSPEAWQALELVDRIITARLLRGLVTAWPEGVAIEIRRCHSCGSSIARKAV